MEFVKEELESRYLDLNEENRLKLWQRFASFLNDYELKICMNEVKKGNRDLFAIHFTNGYIQKYQIYFNQVLGSLEEEEDYGRNS
ncbi:hypothetical protein [Spirochaeta isovalerica]|uniref:Heme oxygenase n=1 Tax=Spirochaeta isovalerica TaxID=150 RepID=A0A841R3S9_9SPIO|nr:hypothetical protein [Spirochaeta isovalerica]MBB6478453.1 heme oxygenase [Spirochaeta isovalerica]